MKTWMTGETLAPLAQQLGWTVLHSIWEGVLMASLLAVALHLTRRASAAVRHGLCLLAMVSMLALLVATAVRLRPPHAYAAAADAITHTPASSAVLRESLQVADLPPAVGGSAASTIASPQPALSATSSSERSTPPVETNRPTWKERISPLLPWISGAWALGVCLLSLRHLGGWLQIRSWRRRATLPVPAFLTEAARILADRLCLPARSYVLASARVGTPLLAGFLKPVILIPSSLLTGLGPRELEAIVAHELAHLARHDAWANLLQIVTETLLFYHPAIWWIGQRARNEREVAADDLAVRVLHDDRITYASALTRLAEIECPTPALGVGMTNGSLLARVRHVLGVQEAAEPGSGGWLAALVTLTAVLAMLPLHAQEAPATVRIAPGQSIQAAIDAAAPGTIIQLAEGEWDERIKISKPLTLQGAGSEKTVLKPVTSPAGATPEALADFRKRSARVSTVAERQQFDREREERFAVPTIVVRDTDRVVLRGLRVSGVDLAAENEAQGHTRVAFHAAKGSMEDCAVVGRAGDGIHITDASEVDIQRSLVAALWNLGIYVQGSDAKSGSKPSRLHLADSEVRNVYLYGISLGRGCDSSVIERCQVSSTAWHAIRYDDASPTITGNAIFQTARSGIYASGKTHATVRGNLFWKNEMDGMSCWFDNADTIEGNTFVGNLRENLAVIGESKPAVTRNIFANSPVGIICGATQRRDGGTSETGAPILTANLFWDTPTELMVGNEKKLAPEGSLRTDPKFGNAAAQDFAPAADSPARTASVGALTPLALASRWPLLAQEKEMLPEGDTREFRYWAKSGSRAPSKADEQLQQEANAEARKWVADAFQLDDASKRAAAIEHVRQAMTSADPREARIGVVAFGQLAPVEFDKKSFQPAVRALLGSKDVATRAAALTALTMTGATPEDLERIYALADDPAPEVRSRLTWVIFNLNKGDLTGKAASDAILKLMDKMPSDPRDIAHSLWGGKFSPELEERVLTLCQDIPSAGGIGYNFFYGALSTQANKSERSIKRLIELLAHQDTTNIAGRAAWGLQQGVAPEQYPLVADAMMKLIQARSDGYVRNNAFRCLVKYGTAAQVPALQELLAKPGTDGDFRKTLEATAAALSARPASGTPASPAPIAEQKPAPPASEVAKSTTETTAAAANASTPPADNAALQEKIAILEKRVRELEGTANAEKNLERLRAENVQKARQRASEDRARYQPAQLSEIESLYQVANKNWRSDEARTSLKALLEKYDGANRTGCATLYMGQMSEGQERLDYLNRAVEKFSDCYYLNGCKVGGYGRYVLAGTLWEKGEKDRARALVAEMKTAYADAIDHRGRPIPELAQELETAFAKDP